MLFQIASGMGGAGGAIGAVAGQGAMKRQDIKGKLDQLSPEEVLSANKKNFQVPYTGVTKSRLARSLGRQDSTFGRPVKPTSSSSSSSSSNRLKARFEVFSHLLF